MLIVQSIEYFTNSIIVDQFKLMFLMLKTNKKEH